MENVKILFGKAIEVAGGWRWKLIGEAVAALAIGIVLWILVISPRIENARLEREKTQKELAETHAALDAEKVRRKAEADIGADVAKAISDAASSAAVRDAKTVEIRERVIERAATSDGFVSLGEQQFIEDLSK